MGCSWAAASGVQLAGAYCVATRTACFSAKQHISSRSTVCFIAASAADRVGYAFRRVCLFVRLLLLLLLLYRKRLTWHLVLSELQGHVTMSKS